jgi:acetolactate decarboxylase
VSELEFLGALHVELLRHRELTPAHPDHELFQTSTVQALLDGAFDGDITLGELLEHGDLGLGTLNGLDGELIVIDGQAWKANVDGTLAQPDPSTCTPYAVVVPFSPCEQLVVRGPFEAAQLEEQLGRHITISQRPTAVRIDGDFASVQVRSVPKQKPPYPQLADVIAEQQVVSELSDVSGSMVGFCFQNALEGIEMAGLHLHFASEDRSRGGHVLSFSLLQATVHTDDATQLRVELPPAVKAPQHGDTLDEDLLRRLESNQ